MKSKKIIRYLLRIFACLALTASIFLPSDKIKAVNIAYETELEESYADTYKDISYKKIGESPVTGEEADGVDLATGQLSLLRCDLYLEGTGGMDFSLNRYYNSNEASLGLVTVMPKATHSNNIYELTFTGEDKKKHTIKAGQEVVEKRSQALTDMFYSYKKSDLIKQTPATDTQITRVINRYPYHVYGIGAGWSFDFPWIETTTVNDGDKKDWAAKPAYLHFGSKGVLPIAVTEDAVNKTYAISGFTGYPYADIQLIDYKQTVDGIACRYLLRDKTGLRTYFNSKGVVVLQKDSHNNTITYTYNDNIYFNTITDSVGRTVRFQYAKQANGMSFLSSVTVSGAAGNGGVSTKKTEYETEAKEYTTMDGKKLTGCLLKSVKASGVKESYTYKETETLNNAAGNEICTQRSATNRAYLLQKVSSEGSADCYEYRGGAVFGQKDLGEGRKRDVVTQFHYVTREYEQDTKSGRKANGIKYDYYQKRPSATSLNGYYDFYNGGDVLPYGTAGIRNMTVVSTYNPRTHKDNKKVSDYKYKKSAFDAVNLQLLKKPAKTTRLYVYNQNGQLVKQVTEAKKKNEMVYTYDLGGLGRFIAGAEEKNYGTNRNGTPVTGKEEYTYDSYGNETSVKSQAAFLPENADKQPLFTTTYTYHGNGYPATDTAYSLELVSQVKAYVSATAYHTVTFTLAANGVDTIAVTEEVTDGGSAQTISREETTYDGAGNETSQTQYPDYGNAGESIQNTYQYNALGQQMKDSVTIRSAKHPEQNKSYTEEEVTYDSFGNELTVVDKNGLLTKTSYREDTEEVEETTEAVGTQYETGAKEYTSEDGLQSMSIDSSGYGTIEIRDAFGNTIIEKDEKNRTWIERTYDYGEEAGDTEEPEDEEDEEETEEEEPVFTEDDTDRGGLLIEERVYSFAPDGELLITDGNGAETPNYAVGGRGNEVKSATRYYYDSGEEQIGSASFAGGAVDAAHCIRFVVTKDTEEVTGEKTVTTLYEKELNPACYVAQLDERAYYDLYNAYQLSETVTETTGDILGQTLSEKETTTRKGGTLTTVTAYTYDSFGKVTEEAVTVDKVQNGTALPQAQSRTLYTYDVLGNVTETTVKQKNADEAEWESQTTKSEYDAMGQLLKSYDAKGAKDGYASIYDYDLNGQIVKTEIPVKKTADGVTYGVTKNEYDADGNVIATEEKQSGGNWKRTEYTYDKVGQLVLVKNCGEDSLYTQYVYDIEGNKIRQYTGMTKPLTLTIAEGTAEEENKTTQNFSCHGKTYHLTVENPSKKNVYSEVRYEYNERNELIRIVDEEGREETYTYDDYGNPVGMVDKNKTIITCTYDNQNRLTGQVAEPEKKASTVAGGKVTHTYAYDVYGDLVKQDNETLAYEDVSGSLTKETISENGRKPVVKTYGYDTLGNETESAFTIGGKTVLNCRYAYDGFSRLKEVKAVEDGTETTIVSYTYDENGSLLETAYTEPGISAAYTYDEGNRLTKLVNSGREGEELSAFESSYAKNSQKLKETSRIRQSGKDTVRTTEKEYTYDDFGRLVKESAAADGETADTISYTYDSFHNRKERKAGNKVTAYRYNKNNELLRTDELNTKTGADEVTLYRYDKSGNQLAATERTPTDNGGKTVFDLDITLGENRLNDNVVNHYNGLNQPLDTLTKNCKVSYEYGGDGLRTKKTVNGKETVYVWEGDELVLELNSKDEVTKRYFRGNTLICADRGSGTEKTYYLYNPHGDVIQLADSEGKLTKSYEYDSFGNEVKPDAKDENPFRYSGEYYDKEMATVYLRARSYAPETGRFTTRDSYTGEEDDPLSLHLYAYCSNDGVNQVDPSGHWGSDIHTGLTTVISWAIGFTEKDARDVVRGCQFGDARKKRSTWKSGFRVKIPNIKEKVLMTQKDFNSFDVEAVRAKRRFKLDIHTPREAVYKGAKKKSNIKLSKNFSKDEYYKKLFVSGVWLHAVQDRWAHGLNTENIVHDKSHTDNYLYDCIWIKSKGGSKYVYEKKDIRYSKEKLKKYSSKKLEKMLKKNSRMWHTISNTISYISRIRTSLRKQGVEKFIEKKSKKDIYIDVIQYFRTGVISRTLVGGMQK